MESEPKDGETFAVRLKELAAEEARVDALIRERTAAVAHAAPVIGRRRNRALYPASRRTDS